MSGSLAICRRAGLSFPAPRLRIGQIVPMIDVHNHFYPPGVSRRTASGLQQRAGHHRRGRQPAAPLSRRLQRRRARPSRHRLSRARCSPNGVGTQVISLTTPGMHVEAPAMPRVSPAWSTTRSPCGRRRPPAASAPSLRSRSTIPPPPSANWSARATQLEMRGAMLFSNINGVALADQRYWPLYEAADLLGAVLHIHPTRPSASRP